MSNLTMKSLPMRERLPVAYSTEIGRIITRWALVEHWTRKIVYLLLNLSDEAGRIAVRSGRIGDMITLITDLTELNRIKTGVNWKNLKKDLQRSESFRNRLAHGIWAKSEESNVPILQDLSAAHVESDINLRKAKIYPIAVPIRLEQLKNISNEIEEEAIYLKKIYAGILKLRNTSRGKSQGQSQ